MATDDLKALEVQGLDELKAAGDEAALRAWNGKFLGEKGLIRAAQSKLGAIPKDQKAAYGQEFNRVKTALAAAYDAALAEAKEKALQASLTSNPLDVTLPGRSRPRGRLAPGDADPAADLRHLRRPGLPGLPHPRSRRRTRPNFELLNMPAHHPARDMWDTFHTTTPGVAAAHAHRPGPDPRHARSAPASRSA